MHGSEFSFQREQSDVVFIKFQTFYVAIVLKRVLYSALYVQSPFRSTVVAESTVM
jgi:hypothetical protein